jgi:hypothetical protein
VRYIVEQIGDGSEYFHGTILVRIRRWSGAGRT